MTETTIASLSSFSIMKEMKKRGRNRSHNERETEVKGERKKKGEKGRVVFSDLSDCLLCYVFMSYGVFERVI